MSFKNLCKQLETKIQESYERGITLETAERLASEFLYAQIQVSAELKTRDLDARMRKSGVKAVRAAIYLDIISKSDKKPTEAQIGAVIDSDELVLGEQKAFDVSEVDKAELERYYDIFSNAHIHYRSIAKGKFGDS